MDSLEVLVVVAHVVVAVAVIGLVLLQHGKGADAGAAFGAGASQTVFGSQGTGSFLSKTTALLALIFFLTSFGLAYLAKQKSVSVESNPLGLPQALMDGGADRAEEQPAIDADVDDGLSQDADGARSGDMVAPERAQDGGSVQNAPKVEDDAPAAIDSGTDMPQIDALETPEQTSAPEQSSDQSSGQ